MLKPDEKRMLRNRYKYHRKHNNALTAIEKTINWYAGWYCRLSPEKLPEKHTKEIEAFLLTLE